MDLKVLDDERAPTIVNSLIAIVATVAAQNYILTAICTHNASNEVSVFNEFDTSWLPRQTTPPIIRIACVIHTANQALCDFWTESEGAKLRDIRKILAVFPDHTDINFSNIPRL
jgi:hypothetical protein